MRPCKNTIPMNEWNEQQLKSVIKSKKSTPKLRTTALNILEHNRKNYKETVENFFNIHKNKFWNLALWQLYREGKAKQYGVGEHKRFYIEDISLVIDKMIEIRRRLSNFEATIPSNSDKKNITRELHTWKR